MTPDTASEPLRDEAHARSSQDARGGTLPLQGLLVIEVGARLGAAVCGSILAQLGAEVVVIERPSVSMRDKWLHRDAAILDKRSVIIDEGVTADRQLFNELLSIADMVIHASDISPCDVGIASSRQIICDITAFGTSGPLAGQPYSDALIQAIAGIADTTGNPDAPPSLIGFPFCEVSAGIYAAAATLVAHRVKRTQGFGQSIDMALYDCAVNALSTFLPFHAVGKPVTRSGNRHSLAAPWNAYRASDGWVLICTATDEQWRRLCNLIKRPELAQREGYVTNAERITRRGDVDAVVQAWTQTLSVSQCIEQLSANDLACGPILTLTQLRDEPNLRYRNMLRRIASDPGRQERLLPGSPLSASLPTARDRTNVPKPDEHRDYVMSLISRRTSAGNSTTASADLSQAVAHTAAPLAGIRVLEIGQYTTAPLVGRQLGALGAEVYKIEPPGGEGSRAWPPTQGNRGYFFAFSNSDKKSLELDLRKVEHRAAFTNLLRTADVLVENLKPGALARLGFGPDELGKLNPRLVYCGISGFGAASVFPGRPAFDTVVQAMSGFMDLTRTDGIPVKAGISAADLVGGGYGLVAILAALELRDQTQRGQMLDISMQDAAVAATASLWNREPAQPRARSLRCADGFVCIEVRDNSPVDALEHAGLVEADTATLSRDELVRRARHAGLEAAPVRSVSEVALAEQTVARGLLLEQTGEDGLLWPLLNSPLRLQRTPPKVCRPIGELGEANDELLGSSSKVKH